MGYLKIPNLYKLEAQSVLLFKHCYALEKIHGTSAHISWNGNGKVSFYSGGVKHEDFVGLFDQSYLPETFEQMFGEAPVIVYGEAYGGKCQGMADTYGPDLKFVVFDVRVGGKTWLRVPHAESVAFDLCLEFVHYEAGETDLTWLDYQRDKPSEQAIRNGIIEEKPSEGIVIRPMEEFRANNGKRVIAKHKRAEFRETKTPRPMDPEKQKLWEEANEIADEWVTEMRLAHVLDKLDNPTEIDQTGDVCKAMIEDVLTEGFEEIVDSKEARKAIGKRAALLYRRRVTKVA